MVCKLVGTPTHNDILCDPLEEVVKSNSKTDFMQDGFEPADCYTCINKSDLLFDSFCNSAGNPFQISIAEKDQQCIKDSNVCECSVWEAKAYSLTEQDLGSVYAQFTSELCLCQGDPLLESDKPLDLVGATAYLQRDTGVSCSKPSIKLVEQAEKSKNDNNGTINIKDPIKAYGIQ